jgi:CheY-like chemotaxis protein
MLVHGGHAVTAVPGLREAKAVLRTLPLDLVVTDVYMPDADGLEVLQLVRQEHPSLPVIVISGRFAADTFGKSLMMSMRKLGAAGTLAKPVTPSSILACVEEVMAGRVLCSAPDAPAT